ncbi:MAG TPA: anti-sigma factor [Thermoanaerobaculia bacterium]|nr:anti-sigma factor [Thermoanaerobaculia bacterium]
MSDSHTPCGFRELLPGYALGALEPEELDRLEGHLAAECPECAAELDELRRDLEVLVAAAPPVAPSPLVRRRLLAQVARERRDRALPRWLPLAAAVAALLLTGLGWMWLQRDAEARRLRGERDRLASRLAQTEGRLAAAEAQRAALARQLAIVAAPGGRQFALAGLGPATGAAGRTFVDPATGRAVFFASGLPRLAGDRTYQLWVIPAGAAPVPAGVFAVDAGGGAVVQVETVPDAAAIEAWAVTIEPSGGVPQPTGEMVLHG